MRDRDVRKALHAKVLAEHHGDPSTLVLDEVGVRYGLARVDVMVVNGQMHGYEIKSDQDTLSRLPEQARLYSEVLDRVTLVLGRDHVEDASALVPAWWGMKVVTQGPRGGVHFVGVRPARNNPSVDPAAVAALLWCEELIDVLASLDCARGMRGKPRETMARRLATLLPLDQLRETVRDRLKRRPDWRAAEPRT